MQLLRSRRSTSLLLLSPLLLAVYFLCKGPAKVRPALTSSPTVQLTTIWVLGPEHKSPHGYNLPPSQSLVRTKPAPPTLSDHVRSEDEPRFHLLVPASGTNPDLCKTVLSALFLDYPPPTLINYGKAFTAASWDKGTHVAKIRGVRDYLSDGQRVREHDLVLVVDGYDIWFQLPPAVLLHNYQTTLRAANDRLLRKYGTAIRSAANQPRIQRYTQSVIWGADKICWPNSAQDPACASVPSSTLPFNVYGKNTDKDDESFLNTPKYLNSGAVLGTAASLLRIYTEAFDRVENHGLDGYGDQYVFAALFGEQEYAREASRHSERGGWSRLVPNSSWARLLPFLHRRPASPPNSTANSTFLSAKRHELGMGLDYESRLFQTMTHSAGDITFLTYSNKTQVRQARRRSHLKHPLTLVPSLAHTALPLGVPDTNGTDGSPSDSTTWKDVPLATNVVAGSIPLLLHFNGDFEKQLRGSWWPRMWFGPHARALLHTYLQKSSGTIIAEQRASEGGAEALWPDTRGGRGGVWTDGNQWLNWTEVCGNYHEELFGDGLGRFETDAS